MRPFAWRHLLTRLILPVVLFSLIIYSFWVEPYWIEVTRSSFRAPLRQPLKLAQLTDIHTSGIGRRENLMLKVLESESPDLIVITGDSISITSDYPGAKEVLQRMHAPLGVWLVRGNHEDWWPIDDEQTFYREAGVRMLVNENARVRDDFYLVGLDDQFGGSPNLNKAVEGIPTDAFKIALFHSPAYFDSLAGHCDIAFAGHTHGGQARLPFIGPLWLPKYSGHYVEGWFEKNGTRMYVSRGVGTSIVDARFCCRPEIAIFTISE